MLFLTHARVPIVLLPPEWSSCGHNPLEPTVLCDVTIAGDCIANVAPAGTFTDAPGTTLDLDGALVLPALVDAHVHLDKTHSWFRAPNRSGTFAEALDVLWRDKEHWSEEDLLRRARFALRCAWAHGTRVMRTHVDSGFPGAATSHAVMAALRREWAGRIELQTVPLVPIARYADADGDAIADLALGHGAVALGGMPLMSPELPRQLDRLLAMARARGVGLDLHVDESGNPEARCLQAVAEAVLRRDFPHPVVCGHCCSLAVQPLDAQRATIDAVRAAGLGIISLPLCNLYLQDRRPALRDFPRSPHWRGLTLVHDLLDAGVPVACASDNVRDAFHAYGDYNLLDVYSQSVRLAHLDARLAESIRVVTTTAADLVGRTEYGRIAPGAPARFTVLGARSFSELLSRAQRPLRLIDGETVHTPELPEFFELVSVG